MDGQNQVGPSQVPHMEPPKPDVWAGLFKCRDIKYTLTSKREDKQEALVEMALRLADNIKNPWGIELEGIAKIQSLL